jgi:nucleotidyltransferase/DNA polymerase involved in DNA repair
VAFVQALPLRKIGGIGPVTEAVLQGGLGLSKVGDLWEQRALLARVVGSEALRYYLDVALGFPSSSSAAGEGEERDKEEGPDRKSISTERTVGAEGVATLSAALAMARALCASLAEDTAKAEVRGRTVTLVLKGVDFQRRSRARSLAAAVGTAEELWPPVRRLVEEFFPEVGPFRLMGVRLSALE